MSQVKRFILRGSVIAPSVNGGIPSVPPMEVEFSQCYKERNILRLAQEDEWSLSHGIKPMCFQCCISLDPTVEKVLSCLQQGNNWGHCPESLFHSKAQSSPGSCIWSPHGTGPDGYIRPHGGQVQVKEQERARPQAGKSKAREQELFVWGL